MLSSLIHQSLLPSLRLLLLPKSQIDLHVTVLEAGDTLEAVTSAGVIAGGAALADGGVEMWGLAVAACTVSAFPLSDRHLVNTRH